MRRESDGLGEERAGEPHRRSPTMLCSVNMAKNNHRTRRQLDAMSASDSHQPPSRDRLTRAAVLGLGCTQQSPPRFVAHDVRP